eukprot:scaffold2886_cov398-Prasinococcus_capsulatus_cf.AAC.19
MHACKERREGGTEGGRSGRGVHVKNVRPSRLSKLFDRRRRTFLLNARRKQGARPNRTGGALGPARVRAPPRFPPTAADQRPALIKEGAN